MWVEYIGGETRESLWEDRKGVDVDKEGEGEKWRRDDRVAGESSGES